MAWQACYLIVLFSDLFVDKMSPDPGCKTLVTSGPCQDAPERAPKKFAPTILKRRLTRFPCQGVLVTASMVSDSGAPKICFANCADSKLLVFQCFLYSYNRQIIHEQTPYMKSQTCVF